MTRAADTEADATDTETDATKITSDDSVRMKELTERIGITPRTLRFWEEHGLIGPGRRGNVRVYNPEEVSQIEHIVKLRRAGLSIDEVRAALNAVGDGTSPEKYMATRLAQLRRKALEQVSLIDELLGNKS